MSTRDQILTIITLVLASTLWATWRLLARRYAFVVTFALVATVIFVPISSATGCFDYFGRPRLSGCTTTTYSLVGIRYPEWGSAVTAAVFGAWLVVFLVFVARRTWRAMG